MATHYFEKEIATKYGIACAVLYQHIKNMCKRNKGNKKFEFNQKTWMFCTMSKLRQIFPYLSENKIKTSLKTLEEEKLIEQAKFAGHSDWYRATKDETKNVFYFTGQANNE